MPPLLLAAAHFPVPRLPNGEHGRLVSMRHSKDQELSRRSFSHRVIMNDLFFRFRTLAGLILVGLSVASSRAQTSNGGALNVSMLVTLTPNSTATMGLVVGQPESGNAGTYYLVRGVGPSLSEFGISNGVQQPKLTLFNSAGANITPTTYAVTINWNATFAQVGAFALLSDSPSYTGPVDAYFIAQLAPGIYSVQVHDASNLGGKVLLEAYVSPPPITTGVD